MPSVMLHDSARQSLTQQQTELLRHIGIGVMLGIPAQFIDPQGQLWHIYDDPRMKPTDAAYGAVLFANLDAFDYDPTGKEPDTIRSEVRAWADQFNPTVPDIEEGDLWGATIAANGDPVGVRMFNSVPPEYTPYSPEEA